MAQASAEGNPRLEGHRHGPSLHPRDPKAVKETKGGGPQARPKAGKGEEPQARPEPAPTDCTCEGSQMLGPRKVSPREGPKRCIGNRFRRLYEGAREVLGVPGGPETGPREARRNSAVAGPSRRKPKKVLGMPQAEGTERN